MSLTLSVLVAAAGCGALIGSVRQWSEQTRQPELTANFGGVRTHTFWAMIGYLSAAFAWALPVALGLVAAHLIAMRWRPGTARAPGGTGFAAALLTILIGALMAIGEVRAAIVVTALVTVLLGVKQPIHAWTQRFTPDDIRGALQFAAITGIVLPLVPNRALDPWGALNPFKIWLMVVLISGLGFAGYVAMRVFGARAGITATALLGGLASSTASTLAFARRSRAEPVYGEHYAFATVVACTVMLPRVALAVAVFSPALARDMLIPFAAMAAPAGGFALWFWARRPKETEVAAPAVSNPLGLGLAIKFAGLYAAISLLVKLALDRGWQGGFLPLGFVSGLTDVDAISLTVAQTVRDGGMDLALAGKALVLAAVANSLLKLALAMSIGARGFRGRVALALGATAVTGAGWVWLS